MADEQDDQVLRTQARAAAKAIRRYPDVFQKHLALAMKIAGADWRSAVLRQINSKKKSAGTGQLGRSLSFRVTGRTLADTQLSMASRGVPYAAAQELGATIKPKPGRRRGWLTIPTDAAKTAGGVLRKSAHAWFQNTSSGGDSEGKQRVFMVFFSPTEGAIYLSKASKRKRGKGPKPAKLFSLRKKTTLPGPTTTGAKSRLGFFDNWDQLQPKRLVLLQKAIEGALLETAGQKEAAPRG